LTGYRYKSIIDKDIFGEVDTNKLRTQKPVSGIPPKQNQPTSAQLQKLRKIKPDIGIPVDRGNALSLNLQEGQWVDHPRFGRGVVKSLEGLGNDMKADIDFEHGGAKKLLLRFAQLTKLDNHG